MNEASFEVGSSGAHTLGSSSAKWSQVWTVNNPSLPVPAITFTNDVDTGFYFSGSGSSLEFSFGSTLSTQDVYSLYHAGKTMKYDTQEYVDVILKLPWVIGNQLKMVETFEYFRRQLFPEADEL
jgi:hypothetical protein